LSDVLQVALSHDIDRVHKTYQYLTRAFRSCMRMRFGAALKEILSVKESRSVYWNFEDIMETEDKHSESHIEQHKKELKEIKFTREF